MTLISQLQHQLASALTALDINLPEGVKIQISAAQDLRFGDYQSNIAMMLAKRVKMNPRQLATQLLEQMNVAKIAECSIAGPGFINFKLLPSAWSAHIELLLNHPHLGIKKTEHPRKIVIDFSSPNVAKPMHVGHIRSTIIGDTLARVARFLGHEVITDNHIGDWGTQFGKVIYGWKQFRDDAALQEDPLAELLRLYKTVHELSKEQENIADVCREELVKLQQGDEENVRIWKHCVQLSIAGLEHIYQRLDISFDHWLGESFYNDSMETAVKQLVEDGIARESDGALCVFSNNTLAEKKDPFKIQRDGDWQDLPMIVRKKDGGYGYAASDIATINYRVQEWQAEEILYVVDARQASHFQQLFAIAERKNINTQLEHVSFGTINGKDGKPLKTREGDLPQLEDILNDAIQASAEVLKSSDHLNEEEKKALAETIGIGSVKFFELSHHRTSDYIFDLEKMVALQGDTAPYLMYSLVRINSIFRKKEEQENAATKNAEESSLEQASSLTISEDAEIHLARMLSRFAELLPSVLDGYKPNLLSSYLIELARSFHSFFEACPVLKSEGQTQITRLALCKLTSDTITQGLTLLGIKTPERM